MGNSISCFPLKQGKGRESNFIRKNWRNLLKRRSKSNDCKGEKVGLSIKRVGKFEEEWELVDIEDDTCCLSVAEDQVSSPKRLTVSPTLTISPRSSGRQEIADLKITYLDSDNDGFKNFDFDHDLTVTRAKFLSSAGDFRYEDTSNDQEPKPSIIKKQVDKVEAYTEQMQTDIEHVLEVLFDRVEAAYAYREVSDEEEDRSSTPPKIEGEIYQGPGILKATQFGDTSVETRRITWAADVKQPASDGPELDPITAAFARERSKLALTRTPEQKQLLRIARRARRRANKYRALFPIEEIPKSRIPVRTEQFKLEKFATASIDTDYVFKYKTISVPRGCRIPIRVLPKMDVTLKTDNKEFAMRYDGRENLWPKKLEDMDTASARAGYVDKFQGTQLFKQRHRKKSGDKTLSRGLKRVENANSDVTTTAAVSCRPKRISNKEAMICRRISPTFH